MRSGADPIYTDLIPRYVFLINVLEHVTNITIGNRTLLELKDL
jgi:hypothetical protein